MSSRMIGTVQFEAMEGLLFGPGVVNEIIDPPPGWGGYCVRQLGPRAKQSTLRTVTFCADSSAMATFKNTFAAMQGTLQTVYDALGNYQNNVLIVACTPIEEKAVVNMAGDNNIFATTRLLTMEWTILYPYGA